MVNQPVAALSLTRRFPSYFSWNTVLAVEKNEATFLNTISRYSLHEVAAFVRTFRRSLRTDNIPWFDKLLDTEGFRSSLDNRSPDEIAAFLKLCNEMRPELVKELGVQLMASDKFKQVSKHAFPQHVGSLVVFLEKELPGSSATYLSAVIRSDEFYQKITQAQPNAVAMFLRLAENYAREDVKRILKKLIADKQFLSTLVNSQQSLTTAFLEYLFTREQDGGKFLLRSLLKDPIFTSMTASARPDELGLFIAFSDKHDPKTTEQMIGVLLLRPEFSDANEQLPPLLSPITIRIALRAQ